MRHASGLRASRLRLVLYCVPLASPQYSSAPTSTAFWGIGWEDPVSKDALYYALPVGVDAVSALTIQQADLTDAFNWDAFEQSGGRSRVRGLEGWQPQSLQSWSPRYDAVQHGHFMVYRMDDAVSTLDGPMEDYFFSVTMDVHVHPLYAGDDAAAASNSSVRFSIYEAPPADLSQPESVLEMVNDEAGHLEVLVGGDPTDVYTRRHRVTWGVEIDEQGGLTGNCTRPVTALYFGVQCLAGWAYPSGLCTPDVTSPPTATDCARYCPFTLTVRAIPRKLSAGETLTTLLGPGQWQTFALDAGGYDLIEVTLDRAEFNDRAHPDAAWRDGVLGRAWLSRGGCLRGANTTVVEHAGYCPHGGALYVGADGVDVEPHRFCSRDLNYSHRLVRG